MTIYSSLDLSKMKTSQVMDTYEKECLKENNDETWEKLYDELLDRPPFEMLLELIGANEERIDDLKKQLKQHGHLGDTTVIIEPL